MARPRDYDDHLNVNVSKEMLADLRRIATRRRIHVAELVRTMALSLIEEDEIARLRVENETLRKALTTPASE